MNDLTKELIISAAKKQGFQVQVKDDGTDLYVKNLVFRSPKYASTVYIHRDTGITPPGEICYLKVAVHPDHFKSEAVNPSNNIEKLINRKTKLNLHSGSNYVDFPIYEGNNEPCGRCYKVIGQDLSALEKLLSVLSST